MKILVCISKVPDTTTKISFTDNNSKFNEDKVQFIINPYDEWYALVRALELKETLDGTVTVINVGKADNEQIIRKALALGADDAVRVDTDPADAFTVANEIAAYAKPENYDIILTGKETINYNSGVVAGMIAELLDLPYVSLASKLDVDGNNLKIEREIEGMKETLKVAMPCVIGAQKGMAEARIPNMRGILASKTKPVKIIAPITNEIHVQSVSFSLPPEKGAVKLFSPDNVKDLAEALHNEAKVF
ncbi:MAG: electron transfer flavoprotein subunit beta/FixA family protein [Fimbriimonadaceae bacterium]|nr:electron transfer flavoprotein subunit beta/FixA family protein [Chitinophagales bacterium]